MIGTNGMTMPYAPRGAATATAALAATALLLAAAPAGAGLLGGDAAAAGAAHGTQKNLEETTGLFDTRANLGIEKLRFLLRLAMDLEYLDPRRYEHAARVLDETGRKVGAWRKTHRAGIGG